MGTRHLTVVISDFAVRLAVYGQYDGYPTSALADIRNALNLPDAWFKCRQNLYQSAIVSEERRGNYETASVRLGYGVIAELVARPVVTVDALDFGQDSLFCEYAYIVDLDRQTVELYSGFNKARAVGAFGGNRLDSEYQPVTFLQAWDCRALAALSDSDLAALEDNSGKLAIAARKRIPIGPKPTSRATVAAGLKLFSFATSAETDIESRVDPASGARLALSARSAGWRVAGSGRRWQAACYVVHVSQNGALSMSRQYRKLQEAKAAFDAGTIHDAA